MGIVGAYLPYQDEAISRQTGELRVVFEENSGLSLVWSVNYLNEIIESDAFKKQFEIIKNLKPATLEPFEESFTDIN